MIASNLRCGISSNTVRFGKKVTSNFVANYIIFVIEPVSYIQTAL
jgi:hypothetical protein